MVKTHSAPSSAGLLSEIIRSNNVYVGGSSMGKGFRRAARYYLRKQAPTRIDHSIAGCGNDGEKLLLKEGVDHRVEDPFLVVDMGMVVSQLYQWRKHFPRVEAFYAMKCNPDPLLVKALAAMGCNFDCASREEIRMVKRVTKDLPPPFNNPDIIYANPAKARSHIIEAVCSGVRLVTFDNEVEVKKCASISKHIQLVMRIITDDSGSQCRLSSKFGAPKARWPSLLKAAKQHGLEVVGVSFHVGSGCRDVTRYEMALRDARALFDLAESEEYGFKMRILDIGGGFPGETHSLWNPADVFGDPTAPAFGESTPSLRQRKYTIDEEIDDEEAEDTMKEGFKREEREETAYRPLLYFTDIADAVTPMLDDMFPAESGVRIIAEPGRYLVAAACTLATSVISVRKNAVNEKVAPIQISDTEAAMQVHTMTRADEDEVIEEAGHGNHHRVITSIIDDLADYSKLYAEINLSQQEVDVYLDKLDLTNEDPVSLLSPPLETEVVPHHSVEGMTMRLVTECIPDDVSIPESIVSSGNALTLAAVGEAALSGVLKQVIADATAGCEDDFSYYINDGVYGSFNNLMFDHATVRPRHLKQAIHKSHSIVEKVGSRGETVLEAVECDSSGEDDDDDSRAARDDTLHPSTIFGPTCDSIDVIGRSVLLPKLSVGDWLYFQNMGAYTCAAASAFNGFIPTEKFYVCSIQPEHFEKLIEGPEFAEYDEEKKDEEY